MVPGGVPEAFTEFLPSFFCVCVCAVSSCLFPSRGISVSFFFLLFALPDCKFVRRNVPLSAGEMLSIFDSVSSNSNCSVLFFPLKNPI